MFFRQEIGTDSIETNINSILPEKLKSLDIQAVKNAYHKASYVNMNEKAGVTLIALSICSIGAYAGYFMVRECVKMLSHGEIIKSLVDGKISIKEAILNILTSVGKTDIYSTKYLFIKNLFGLKAENDKDSELYVNGVIKYLSGNDKFIEFSSRQEDLNFTH